MVKRLAADIRIILNEPAVEHSSSVQHSSTDKIPGRCVLWIRESIMLLGWISAESFKGRGTAYSGWGKENRKVIGLMAYRKKLILQYLKARCCKYYTV